jgi:hypothetical protein
MTAGVDNRLWFGIPVKQKKKYFLISIFIEVLWTTCMNFYGIWHLEVDKTTWGSFSKKRFSLKRGGPPLRGVAPYKRGG